MSEKKLTINPDTGLPHWTSSEPEEPSEISMERRFPPATPPQLPAEVREAIVRAMNNRTIEDGTRFQFDACVDDICASLAPPWQKQMDALTFYANAENYHPTGWQGDMDPSPVNKDNGEKARLALIALKDTRP